MKRAAGLAALFGWLSVTAPALASKVAIVPFDGPKDRTLQLRVAKALEADGVEVTTDAKAADDDPGSIRELARTTGADAVITGRTVVKKGGWVTTLEVRSGADGKVTSEARFEGAWLPALLEDIDRSAAKELAPGLLATGKSATEVEAAHVDLDAPMPARRNDAPAVDAGVAGEAKRGEGGPPPAISLRGGVRIFQRTLEYSEDVFGTLRSYASSASPAPGIAAEWYPAAHLGEGALADLGLLGSFERGLATVSRFESATAEAYETTLQNVDLGLRYRIHLGDHELGVSGRYSAQSFEVAGDVDRTAISAAGAPVSRDLLPDVRYESLRPGLDLRLSFGDVLLGATAGYRFVQSAGDLGSRAWFPDVRITAGDAGLFLGYAVGEGVSLLAGAEVTRYGLDMRSRPADLRQGREVAGGAVDQYASGWLALEWRGAGAGPAPRAVAVASR
ncbi:MAG: hypothetical protein FJ104_15225 [Deltaproteobacteria bacterium]|nr:hypothetical protein [Deltaproteobacteria bacterium]